MDLIFKPHFPPPSSCRLISLSITAFHALELPPRSLLLVPGASPVHKTIKRLIQSQRTGGAANMGRTKDRGSPSGQKREWIEGVEGGRLDKNLKHAKGCRTDYKGFPSPIPSFLRWRGRWPRQQFCSASSLHCQTPSAYLVRRRSAVEEERTTHNKWVGGRSCGK